ncbi:hypothetical protein SynBOUM118_02757 [Synechococcus sp. BOUM118]|nr:hypothetical protein SynBOUM118_02757 [Synechococcus sp. BOUM118]
MNEESAKSNEDQDIFSQLMKEVSTLALLKESDASIIQGKILIIIVGIEKDGELLKGKEIKPKHCNISNEEEFQEFIKGNYKNVDTLYVRYFRPGDIELSEITKYIIK